MQSHNIQSNTITISNFLTSPHNDKKAFTLAEVLITLGIIGVVAALTMPSLINDNKNKQYAVAYKKIYANMSNALNLFKFDNGCDGMDIGDCIQSVDAGDNNCEGFTPVAAKLKYIDFATGADIAKAAWIPENTYNVYGEKLPNGNYATMNKSSLGCFYLLADGMTLDVDVDPTGYKMMVDVNGKKLPNRIGKDIHPLTVGCASNNTDAALACSKTHKDVIPFINDTFSQTLYKGLCTSVDYYLDTCDVDNLSLSSGKINPASYILLYDKLPEYKLQ